jgi:hypothetical protein
MKINKKLVISSVCLVALFAFAVTPVFAQFGFEYGSQLQMGTRDLRSSIMQVINILMGFLGIVAIIIILAGGFKWMTAMGSEDKIAEARKLIVAGIVGLGIILASYAISFFVLNSLMNATT